MSATSLPPGFQALEPFAAKWAAPTTPERASLRDESTEAERLAFYEAAKPLISEGLARLDQKPIASFDDKETRLMNLLLSMAHITLAVESQGPDEEKHLKARRHLPITRASADLPSA